MATEVQAPRTVVPETRTDPASGGVLSEIWCLTGRSLRKLTRNPAVLFFSLMMPMIWLVLFSQMFAKLFARGTGRGGRRDRTALRLRGRDAAGRRDHDRDPKCVAIGLRHGGRH
jgi:hypothetical protein